MDQITVDLGPSPEVLAGSEAVLLGRQDDAVITAEAMASTLGTINYEVTCNLSSRVERRYVG
jgi:alanine racemase